MIPIWRGASTHIFSCRRTAAVVVIADASAGAARAPRPHVTASSDVT